MVPESIEPPAYLYKYCSAPRAAQIVRDLNLYLAPASHLNDLYEFSAKALLTEQPNSKVRVFARQLRYEEYCDSEEESMQIATQAPQEELDSTYASFLDHLDRLLAFANQHTGVTCFSESPNNQRMWGTYGANHTGVVLEFTTDPRRNDFAREVMPVFYLGVKPDICPSMLVEDDYGIDSGRLSVLFCVKSPDWKDEKEWRLLRLSQGALTTRERLRRFNRTAIERIYLGPRISESDEADVRSAADTHNPPIPIYKRRIDSLAGKEDLVGMEVMRSGLDLERWVDRFVKKPEK